VIGEGPAARTVRIELQPYAGWRDKRAWPLTTPLRDLWHSYANCSSITETSCSSSWTGNARKLGPCDEGGAREIAKTRPWHARIAGRLLAPRLWISLSSR